MERQILVLVVEKDPYLADLERYFLERQGFKVEFCGNGLPGMDGIAVARAFREDDRLKDVFLIALTGYAQPEDLERVMAAGFDGHLAKPVEMGTLQRMLG